VHCPPGTRHVILGAGDGPCLVLGVGARDHRGDPARIGYPVDPAALRHGAGVDREAASAEEAYAGLPPRQPARCRDDWLP